MLNLLVGNHTVIVFILLFYFAISLLFLKGMDLLCLFREDIADSGDTILYLGVGNGRRKKDIHCIPDRV